MSETTNPTADAPTVEDQVRYLIDRAAISDTLFAFARAIDTRAWQACAHLFVEDGVLELPFQQPDGTFAGHVGQDGMAAYVQNGMGGFTQTHHLSANHQITIDGDTARTISYCQCVHRHDQDPGNIWELGGWFHCDLRRTDAGWRFERVRLEAVWEHGRPYPAPRAPAPWSPPDHRQQRPEAAARPHPVNAPGVTGRACTNLSNPRGSPARVALWTRRGRPPSRGP